MTSSQRKSGENWRLIKEASAETVLRRKALESGDRIERSSNFGQTQSRERSGSVFVTKEGNAVGGGTNNVLNALAAYLRYLEGTARDDWQEYVDNLPFDVFVLVNFLEIWRLYSWILIILLILRRMMFFKINRAIIFPLFGFCFCFSVL